MKVSRLPLGEPARSAGEGAASTHSSEPGRPRNSEALADAARESQRLLDEPLH